MPPSRDGFPHVPYSRGHTDTFRCEVALRGGVPHLHVAGGFSARFGASHPHDLVARAAERGVGTLALTDRDMVTGAVRFAKAVADAGVKPVFGVDLGVSAHPPGPRCGAAPGYAAAHTSRTPTSVPRSWRGMRPGAGGCAGWCPSVPAAALRAGAPSRHRGRCSPSTRAGAWWSCSARHRSRCGRLPPAVRDLAVQLLGPCVRRSRRLAAGGRVPGPA
ncbi:PHP domain-containing protein [Streptomyces sp. NPDC096205]|uniref:PHP domain-containing protein n=1 Tax=Streptomyces sp. NPDC096205 TaxID=3366081 RepID=UPI00382628E7